MERVKLQPYFLQPTPELSPEQVIKIQLNALKRNNSAENDLGIAAAFVFASPANKMSTGPLTRFARMVKAPLYKSMLNHRSANFEPIDIDGDFAKQRVILIDAENHQVSYIFSLSRQYFNPYWNCWMTDSVVRDRD
jgi:hypothetical protein